MLKRRIGFLPKETDEKSRMKKVFNAALTASKEVDRKRQSERKEPRQREFECAGHMEK